MSKPIIIIPYEKNAKEHPRKQIELIAKSIQRFGWQQPIKVGKDNVIIAGHGRYIAYTDYAELFSLPIMWVIDESGKTISGAAETRKLTDKEERAYRLADNQINALSGNDKEMVLEELKSIDMELVELTGFSTDLVLDDDEKDDVVPQAPKIPKSKIGDIYILGKHRLMCGDSLSHDQVALLMDGAMADMVFTDPPWNVAIGLDSNPKHRQREGLVNDNLGKDFFEFLEKTAKSIVDFNKGDTYCVMGCEEWPNVHKALTEAGLHWSNTVVWAKDIFVLGRSKYHRQYEPIWYGWKDKSTYKGTRSESDLWQCKRPRRSDEHPTMKPVELVERALVNSSVKDDIILDLFLGGGSTLIAAEKTGRVCYGMEIDPKYCDVIVERYVQYTSNSEIIKNGKKILWKKN